MSAPAKPTPPGPDPFVDLARELYIEMSGRIYGTLAGPEVKKPEPKALAAFCFRLSEAFELASKETDRAKAAAAAASKASVKLDDVDLSGVFKTADLTKPK
jgi:hypothetical protein